MVFFWFYSVFFKCAWSVSMKADVAVAHSVHSLSYWFFICPCKLPELELWQSSRHNRFEECLAFVLSDSEASVSVLSLSWALESELSSISQCLQWQSVIIDAVWGFTSFLIFIHFLKDFKNNKSLAENYDIPSLLSCIWHNPNLSQCLDGAPSAQELQAQSHLYFHDKGMDCLHVAILAIWVLKMRWNHETRAQAEMTDYAPSYMSP